MEPYAAAALVMVGSGSEATNRIESLRLVGLAARTAAFALHCGDAAIVVKKNFVAAKLTGDDPLAAAEKPFITPSASSMPRTESLRPTTMMGLRSASIVGVQDVVLVRRSCFRRSSSRLTSKAGHRR